MVYTHKYIYKRFEKQTRMPKKKTLTFSLKIGPPDIYSDSAVCRAVASVGMYMFEK